MKVEKIVLDLSVFSLSRSGSTLIENFLDQIFINPKAECTNGILRYWKETQTTSELTGKCDSDFLIINIRDFRDMAASSWRIRHANYKDGIVINKMSPALIEGQSKWAKEEIELLNNIVDKNPNALIVKYEDNFKDLNQLIQKIESYLKIKIPKNLIENAKKYVNFNDSKKISNDLINHNMSERDQFDVYDTEETSIHARHIYTGNHGTWKEFVDKEFWELYQEPMLDGLRRYDYEVIYSV